MSNKSSKTLRIAAPLSPEALRYLLHDGPFPVGEARALEVLQINRTTLGRWLAGTVKVPHSARLVLEQMAEGIPLGGSARWRGFRFDGDELVTPTGERLHAGRLEKWEWLEGMRTAQIAAMEKEVAALRGQLESLRRLGGSANDAIATEPPPRLNASS